jgi:hypothetical protein
MMSLGLVAKGRPGAARLKIVEKFAGQVYLFAEKGSAGIEQGCFRLKVHGHQ